ncbi:Transcription factor RF2b [Bienertia sinuspersici]
MDMKRDHPIPTLMEMPANLLIQVMPMPMAMLHSHSEGPTTGVPNQKLASELPTIWIFPRILFTGSSTEEIGSEDDLFTTYIDMDKLAAAASGSAHLDDDADPNHRPKHRHSNSVDATSSPSSAALLILWMLRKLCLLINLLSFGPLTLSALKANRQSAATSKERKARYILELERKVQTLQTEATTLSAQLTLGTQLVCQRKTQNSSFVASHGTNKPQLRDALNEALKQEVERLRVATGEMMGSSESFNLGMPNMQYNSSAYYSLPQQHVPHQGQQSMQLPSYHQSQGNMHHHMNSANNQNPSEFMPNDPLGRLQGLDIGSRGPPVVKSEGASMSASESSTTY